MGGSFFIFMVLVVNGCCLVIILESHVGRPGWRPFEGDAPLVVHADCVAWRFGALEGVEFVGCGKIQVFDFCGGVQVVQSLARLFHQAGLDALHNDFLGEQRGGFIGKRKYHAGEGAPPGYFCQQEISGFRKYRGVGRLGFEKQK